jgi:hypothetical protein
MSGVNMQNICKITDFEYLHSLTDPEILNMTFERDEVLIENLALSS